MVNLVADLVEGQFFIMYTVDGHELRETVCRVIERKEDVDLYNEKTGNIVVRAFSYKDGGYYFKTDMVTLISDNTKLKITPISQARAEAWINEHKAYEKLAKAVSDAANAYQMAKSSLEEFQKHFDVARVYEIEGEKV